MFRVQYTPLAGLIEIRDDLDASSTPGLDEAMTLAASESNRIVVSLEHCDYCDSSALGVFIRQKKRLGDRLIIVVPKNITVRRIFEITDLINVLDIADSLPDPLLLPPFAS